MGFPSDMSVFSVGLLSHFLRLLICALTHALTYIRPAYHLFKGMNIYSC